MVTPVQVRSSPTLISLTRRVTPSEASDLRVHELGKTFMSLVVGFGMNSQTGNSHHRCLLRTSRLGRTVVSSTRLRIHQDDSERSEVCREEQRNIHHRCFRWYRKPPPFRPRGHVAGNLRRTASGPRRSNAAEQPQSVPDGPWCRGCRRGSPICVAGLLTDSTSFVRGFPAENCQPHKSRLPINIDLDPRALTVVPGFSPEQSRFGEKVHARMHPVPFTIIEVYERTKDASRYGFV
jgi:hypothetical protein